MSRYPLCIQQNLFSWWERCIDLVLNKWLCSHRPVCAYANASEMLFAPIQHASMCAQRAHRLRAGSEGKSRRCLFAVESIRPDSIKHFSAPSTPLPPETPPLRDKKQSNQSMSQSGSQLVVESVALVLLPSLCGVILKRMFDTTGCFLRLKGSVYKYTCTDGRTCWVTPPPLALCS